MLLQGMKWDPSERISLEKLHKRCTDTMWMYEELKEEDQVKDQKQYKYEYELDFHPSNSSQFNQPHQLQHVGVP